MYKPTEAGIISSEYITCQHLEAPELPDTTAELTPELEADSSFQFPFGAYSPLSDLQLGRLSSVETLLLSVLNYRSNWDSGKTWQTSLRKLSRLTGISVRYVRDTLAKLFAKEWVSSISIGINTGSRYQITHHNCSIAETPTDRDGNPLKFAIPRGESGILEQLFNGKISWKAALIWIVLKVNSDFRTGITEAISIRKLRNWVSMGTQTICDCLKELKGAGLLKRLNRKHEAGIYKLYPKPSSKPKPKRKAKRKPRHKDRNMRAEGPWRYSYNELWRINVETESIEHRESRTKGLWKSVSDYTRVQVMPKAIREDFKLCLEVTRQLREKLGVTDSTQRVTDSTQRVTDSAQPHMSMGDDPSIYGHS